MADVVRFVFSFRSPYAWLAFHRLDHLAPPLEAEVEYLPVFPPPDFDRETDPAKLRYIRDDVIRQAQAFGLEVRWPEPFDTGWIRPHAAFLFAADRDRGADFALAAYNSRFCGGNDIGREDQLEQLAARIGLDPGALVDAAGARQYHARVLAGMKELAGLGVFGVPFFIHGSETFWGNDRLEWLVRSVRAAQGRQLPDLARDPCSRPF